MMDLNQIYNTDALEGLKQLDENSIDAIISDPPYQLTSMTKQRTDPIAVDGNDGNGNPFCRPQAKSGFMNKDWDILPSVDILKECLRVLKSGSWAFWMMTTRQDSQLEFLLRLRQAGFNISFSSIEWVFASGFPKAADLSLLADKKACREDLKQKLGRGPTKEEFKEAWEGWREKIAVNPNSRPNTEKSSMELGWTGNGNVAYETKPHSPEAQALVGSYSGMQMKPARELIIISQKPIAGKTYVDQALLHLKDPEHNQLGGTWLDDGRIPYKQTDEPNGGYGRMGIGIGKPAEHQHYTKRQPRGETNNIAEADPNGRFPPNILVSDNAFSINSDGAFAPVKSGQKGFGGIIYGKYDHAGDDGKTFYSDEETNKSLSRYFDLDFWFENKLKELPEEQQKIFPFLYVPKASKSERNKGLSEEGTGGNTYNRKCSVCGKWERKSGRSDDYTCHCQNPKWEEPKGNIHATVKPIKLMSYLITLTTRENDIVLDPFIGSGTTGIASIKLNRNFIGFEREPDYFKIAEARINEATQQKKLGQ